MDISIHWFLSQIYQKKKKSSHLFCDNVKIELYQKSCSSTDILMYPAKILKVQIPFPLIIKLLKKSMSSIIDTT